MQRTGSNSRRSWVTAFGAHKVRVVLRPLFPQVCAEQFKLSTVRNSQKSSRDKPRRYELGPASVSTVLDILSPSLPAG